MKRGGEWLWHTVQYRFLRCTRATAYTYGARRFNVICAGRRTGKTLLGVDRLAQIAIAGHPRHGPPRISSK